MSDGPTSRQPTVSQLLVSDGDMKVFSALFLLFFISFAYPPRLAQLQLAAEHIISIILFEDKWTIALSSKPMSILDRILSLAAIQALTKRLTRYRDPDHILRTLLPRDELDLSFLRRQLNPKFTQLRTLSFVALFGTLNLESEHTDLFFCRIAVHFILEALRFQFQ